MARKPITDLSAWPSLTLEGNLIAPAMVAQIAEPKDDADARESYGIRKGLTIREEISTAFRVGQSHFDAFAKIENPSVEATQRFVRDFLKETFGFDDLEPRDGVVSFIGGERVPVVVVPPAEDRLDRRSPTLSTDRSRSPAFALQDYLNDNDSALWGLVTNSDLIRLMRDNASLTRPAYIEADLAQIFTNDDAASFAILWLLIHRSRFGAEVAPATDCALERWREAGSREGEVARDRLADQVRLALKVLGSGFLEANPDLAAKLKSGEVNLTEWFNELLRLIYRLIFLMVAEDRNLLHSETVRSDARKLYAEGYGLAQLRAQCFRVTTWDRHHDRYEGLKVVFHALDRGEERLGLPALGGLFASGQLPHLETARLRNRALMEGLFRLSWLSDKTGMVAVNWRAMETEELGSVYESLLEIQPQLGEDGQNLIFASEAAEQKGNQRKTTGSYYTPDSLVQALLDTALDPVLEKVEAKADDPAQALLKLSVIDPACGSGHFLLAAARRIATRLARIRAEGTPSLADFRHALRDVARCCIHGVDRNPMAVELTKVALWIETVDPGLPLGFFDAQIRCGDALLGVFDLKVLEDGIPDAAYKPLTGDDKDIASIYKKINAATKKGQGGFDFGAGINKLPETKPLAVDFSGFRDLPEDTLKEVGAKAARFKQLRRRQEFVRAKAACDLFVAAFLLPKTGSAPTGPSERVVPTTEELWMALNQGKIRSSMINAPRAVSQARGFHWPLEFPDIMERGGFDVVLGNPPWEKIKLLEKEFFSARDVEIAATTNATVRAQLIEALRDAESGTPRRALWEEFQTTKRLSEALSTFVRVNEEAGGRFPLTGTGDVNTYALFAELFTNLLGSLGRAGIVAPSALATDSTTAPFFSALVSERRLLELHDFQTGKGFFDAIGHARFKFSLLTLGAVGKGPNDIPLSFFARTSEEYADPRRKFSLSPRDIVRINPNTRTLPVFRTRTDAELTAKMYARAPVLIEDAKGLDGNPWDVGFMAMFHMSNDSSLFRTATQLSEAGFVRDGTDWVANGVHPPQTVLAVEGAGDGSLDLRDAGPRPKGRHVPLVEAKLCNLWDHRASSYAVRGEERGYRVLPETTLEDHQEPRYEIEPFYWVKETEVEKRLQNRSYSRNWLIGVRDITSATNERTAIVSLIPAFGVGNSLPVLLVGEEYHSFASGLLANLSSLAFDFVTRQKVGGTHLNFFILKQLPVFPPTFYTPKRHAFITPRVLELTYTSHSLAPFACDLGHEGPPFIWDQDRRARLRADLDAFYARAYGLIRDELRYILDPADVKGADYPSETFRVLKERETRQYGEYRTQRMVLAAWDRMEADGTFAELGLADASPRRATQRLQLPPLSQLPDGVWAWAQGADERDRVRTQLRAMAGVLLNGADARRARLATLACLNPNLLSGFLSAPDQAQWLRIVGPQARPLEDVATLMPPTNSAWGAAYNELVTADVLSISADGSEWSAGPRLDRSALHVDDPAVGRALFAWSRLQSVDLDQGLTRLSAEIIPFIREGRLAA